jgi:HlyD family secretion protein
MTRFRAILILVVIVIALVGGGLFAATRFRPNEKKDDETRTEIVKRAPLIVKIRETGVLEALVSVNVKSNVEGEIRKIFVHEGDVVAAGDPLIQLDDKQYREQRNQAQANLTAAKAQWEQAKRNVMLTDVRQTSALSTARDNENIARASLEAAQRQTAQSITSAQLEIASTETAVEQDRINLNQARIASTQAQIALETAESQRDSSKVSVDNSERELKRIQELYAKKFVSKSQLEAAQTNYASAKTQYEQSVKTVAARQEAVKSQEEAVAAAEATWKNRLKVLELQRQNFETLRRSREAVERQSQLQLQTAQTQLAEALGSIDAENENSKSSQVTAYANYVRAESALKNANEQLEWTRIVAPIAGTVIDLVVEEGEIVVSGRSAFAQGPSIMTIADLSQMIIKTYINEIDVPNVQVGQRTEIRTDAYPDKVFEGRVKEISPLAQNRPGENVTKFEVQIAVVGSPPELRPGMNVDADIVASHRKDVTQLSLEALIEKQKTTVTLTVPAGEASSLKRGQEVEVQSRSGKRYPGRINALSLTGNDNVTVFINDDAPKGLRDGQQTLALVLRKPDSKKKEDERKIEELPANVKTERKQLVLLPDGEPDEPKPSLFRRMLGIGHRRKDKKPRGIETEIKVGLRNDTAFEILRGVKPGDEVLIPDLSQIVSPRAGFDR